MNILIVYDSLFGNTKRLALAMAGAFDSTNEVKTLSVAETNLKDVETANLLIIGSPTHGGRAKPEMQALLGTIPTDGLKGISTAIYDTRFLEKDQNIPLRLLMKTIGYAAPKIADTLTGKGAKLIAEPEGFIVTGKEGPLKDGEMERSVEWAKNLWKSMVG